jgi:hypothetical protein
MKYRNTALAILILSVFTGTTFAVDWWANADTHGLDRFEGLEQEVHDRISVSDDPKGQNGRVFKIQVQDNDRPNNTSDSRERCETRGHLWDNGTGLSIRKGDTLYFTWKALWTPMPLSGSRTGEWTSFVQIKGYSTADGGPVVALVYAHGENKLKVISYPRAGNENIVVLWEKPWSGSMLDVWHNIAFRIHFNDNASQGWVEFWWDGAQQNMKNGEKRISAKTLYHADQIIKAKFGMYRPAVVNSTGVQYVDTISISTKWPGWRN